MKKDKVKKDEIKKGLKCCSVAGFESSCSDCPYCYRCRDLCKDALDIITKQEKEIELLTRELEKEQEARIGCELEQSWKLSWKDREIDCLRAENKRFENNMGLVLDIEKKNVVKEFAEKLKARITKFIWRYNISECTFNDIMSDLLKEYEK